MSSNPLTTEKGFKISPLTGGKKWYLEEFSGVPSSAFGQDGDFAVDALSNEIYKKVLGQWEHFGISKRLDDSGHQLVSEIVFNEDISAYSVVSNTGHPANSSDPSSFLNKIAGISLSSIFSGFSGDVVTYGEVENLSWAWTQGDTLFLNGTSLSPIFPSTGFICQIAKVLTSTKILVDIQQGILL